MLRRMALFAFMGGAVVGVVACDGRVFQPAGRSRPAVEEQAVVVEEPGRMPVTRGQTLLAQTAAPAPAPAFLPRRAGVVTDPIAIPDCRLTVFKSQEVPAQRDGVILFIGTELKAGEPEPPADKLVKVRVGTDVKKYRELREDDAVEADQLLAVVDNRLALRDVEIKAAKVNQALADRATAEKTRDEAKRRYERDLGLFRRGGGVSFDELQMSLLGYHKYMYDADAKQEAIKVAEAERNQAQTVLEMHEIRSTIPGRIKLVYKKRGEAVRSLEPVFQVHNLERLRVDGMVEVQYASRLRRGMKVVVEPSAQFSPQQTLVGHLQVVTGVAVSRDPKNPLIVSASDDGTVRVWDRVGQRELGVLRHPAAVGAVACSPAGAAGNWCVTGAADGRVRLWDLDKPSEEPARVFSGGHRGAINCVAFAPDGKSCVSGGDDKDIWLWDPAGGEARGRFPAAHRGPVTALQFARNGKLVSAGADRTVRLWALGDAGAQLELTIERRSGAVTQLGVSPDGRHVLFDQDRTLRVLSLPGGLTEGVLQNPSAAAAFKTFAQFSPDGKLILTAQQNGPLQLWRSPIERARGSELRQLVPSDRSEATCAAFAPDGSFIVTGNRDRQVLVWAAPSPAEVEQKLVGEVTLVDRAVASSGSKVRVWAEFTNPDGRYNPGATATLIINPDE